jgi:hypothetical protein
VILTLALGFAVLTPLAVIALLAIALARAAKLGDEQQVDLLEEKYSAPACEGRSRSRRAVR